MKDIYNDKTYLRNNPDWHSNDAVFKAEQILKVLKLIPIPVLKIAEVGCGSAQILVELSNHLPEPIEFHGFDISNDAVNIAKSRETSRIKIERLDLVDESDDFYFFKPITISKIPRRHISRNQSSFY